MSANTTQETVFTNIHETNDAVNTDGTRRRNGGLTFCSEEDSQTPEQNSEDVLVENLFEACDPDGRGKVKVSEVVKYLTTLVDTQLQDKAVDSLVAVLDPAHLDAEVSREDFHRGLRQWINCMKSGYFLDVNVLAASQDPLIFDLSSSKQSLEDSIMEDKQCFSQLSSSLNDLHHQNHRLSEENQEVRSLLDTKEEELARLNKDLLSTRSQIKRLQELADRRHETEAENEDLREQIMSLNSKLDSEKQKTQQLEQERELLKLQMERLKSQVVKLTSDLDSAQQQHEDFKCLLADYKEKISQLKTVCSELDVQAAEKDELVQEMHTRLQDMSSANESLKSQNQELQLQLGEAQQELVRITIGESSSEVNSAEPETVSRVNSIGQLTPAVFQKCSSSIHNELQNLLNDSPDLPWPLSDKELKESGFTAPDLVSQVGHTSKQNKESFKEEPKCVKEPESQSDSESVSSSSGVTDTCSCGHSFEISNKKLRQFVTLMKYFKEENHKLRHIIKHWFKDRELLWKVLKGDSLSSTSTLFKDATVIRSEAIIPEEHSLKEAIKLIRNLQKSQKKALVEISELQRCNLELTEELHKSEIRISELDEECQHIQSCISQEKQKCAELEDSLYKNTLARQLDLKDIWRLVQKDVEAECEDAQEDNMSPITSTERKDKIMKEIKTLRLELQTKEAFLGSLSNNNVSLHYALNYSDHQTDSSQAYLGGRFCTPTPLADTMRMDLFNGNHPGCQQTPINQYSQLPMNQYTQSLVSCEDVDCYQCQAACLFLQNRLRTSYPSVKRTDVNNFKPETDLVMSERTADKFNPSHATSVGDSTLKAVPESDRRMYGYNKWLVYSASKPTGLGNTVWNKSYPHQQWRSSSDLNSSNKHNTEPLRCQTSPVSVSEQINCVTGLEHSSHVTNFEQSGHVTGLDPKLCNNILSASSCAPKDDISSVQDIYKEPVILRDNISESKHKAKLMCTQASQTNQAEDTIHPEGLLRRPSFYAALEQGKQKVTFETTTQPLTDDQSSADNKINPTKATVKNQIQSHHQVQSTATGPQLKTVTFNLVEGEDLDSMDYVTGGAMQLSNSVDTSSLPLTSSSSSQSSALVSVSMDSSTDDSNFPLSSRYFSQKRNLVETKLMEQLESLANEASSEAKDGVDCSTSRQMVTASRTTGVQSTGAELQPIAGGLTVGSTQTQLQAKVSATPDCLSGGKKNWLAKQRRAQMKAGRMKLPEVSEHSEVEARDQMTTVTGLNGSVSSGPRTAAARDMPLISVTNEETLDAPVLTMDVMEDATVPDSLLTKIGLSVANSCANEISIDRLSDKEIESKFLNLSLAFKTDKLTMDKRVNLQQRARDLTEQNMETELTGLRVTVETLNELVTDAEVRSLLQKIKLHVSVLEQTALKLSSRAEVYGAVQQEKRLCKAMEVVMMYTENLRRIREKEESELQEARKLLSERSSNSISTDSESGPGRRSLSVVGYNTVGRVPRRKSEIALPRLVGGGGSPMLVPTSTLGIMPPILGPSITSNTPQETDEGEDPKSRFQSAVASTSLQNVVTSTIRTCSQDRRFPLLASSSSRLSSLQTSTASILPERRGENTQLVISNDEAAFRKGYEEGLKVKLSRELSELRDEQNNINQSLEEVMERVDQSQLEDQLFFSRPTRLEAALSIGSHLRSLVLQYDWRSNKKVIRNMAGVFFFLLAVLVMFLMPPSPTVDVRHISTPPQ